MIDFLDFIQPPEGYIEIRAIDRHGKVDQRFHPRQYKGDLAFCAGVDDDDHGRDVYFGVLPRPVRGGKAEDCTPDSTVLWADLDAKHNALGKKGCLDALLTFPVPASVIVDSGHGYHAYWKLDKAYPFPDCQKAMKGIARYLGGDSVYDQARVLRLPGTHNHKDEIPLPVRTIRLDETRIFQLSDFDEWVAEPRPKYSGWTSDYVPPTKGKTDYVFNLSQVSPSEGTRSETIFRLIVLALRDGWEAPEIEQLIWTSPIGEKAREKGEDQGRRWIQRSIQKAQRG